MTGNVGSLQLSMSAAMLALGSLSACAPSTTVPPSSSSVMSPAPTTPRAATTVSTTGPTTTTASAAPANCPPMATSSASATATPGTNVVRPTLTGITAATGPCGDQVSFHVAGVSSVGYRIGYQDQLRGIGSGIPIAVKGTTVLVVNIQAPAYDDAGQSTYEPEDQPNLVDGSGLTSVQQIAWAGSFEGFTLVGIGVDRVRPYSVVVVAGQPTRVIIEIAR